VPGATAAGACAALVLALVGCGGESDQHFTLGPYRVEVTREAARTAKRAGVHLPALTREAVRDAGRELPGSRQRLRARLIVDYDPDIRGERRGEVSGLTSGANADMRVVLRAELDPEVAADDIRFVIAHEMHHSAREIVGSGRGITLLGRFVMEGAAEAFGYDLTYGRLPTVAEAYGVSPRRERALWASVQRRLFDPADGGLHDRWFVERSDGYVLGYGIVRAYLRRHPGDSAADLVFGEGDRILAASRYRP